MLLLSAEEPSFALFYCVRPSCTTKKLLIAKAGSKPAKDAKRALV